MIIDAKKFVCILSYVLKLVLYHPRKVKFFEFIDDEEHIYISTLNDNWDVIKSTWIKKDIITDGDNFE